MTEPKPKVVEVVVFPNQDGHTIILEAKVTEEDGSITDMVVESNSIAKELRFKLAHLQEVRIRARVTGIVEYDAAQSAVISKPLPEEAPAQAQKQESKGETKVTKTTTVQR